MLSPDYPIETDRLLLRPFNLDDHDALFDIQRRADVARYLYWEPRRAEEMADVLAKRISQTSLKSEGEGLALAVVRRDTGVLIGDLLVFWVSREHRLGEIGYVFHPDHCGQGFATEAAEAGLRLGFEGLGLHRMIGRLDGRNIRSGRLLERLGMRREAHFVENEYVKGEWTDEVVYAMLETEWRAARARADGRVSRAPTP